MVSALLDDPELDTHLARFLHERGLVPLEVLRAILGEVRRERVREGPTLARALTGRGLLQPDVLPPVLEQLRAALDAPPSLGRAASCRPPAVGGTIGPYALESWLGQGGMGTVFVGRHRDTGARHAVKVLPLGGDVEAALRFRREGEAMARVDRHPNVTRVHAWGVEAGVAYLAMDLLPGGDLATRLREHGPLDHDDAARLVEALARGVAHIHAHGVLHRDLKPANVLLDDLGMPRLVDFGLARLCDARSLTLSGTILGSPGYMAPEQAGGLAVDALCDVYGLGAVLYALLTGRPPFQGPSILAVLAQVIDASSPVAPSSLRPGTPPALEAICLRALSKAPADRPQSAAALADALARFRAGELAPPRRRRWPAILGAALAAALPFTAWLLSRVTDTPGQPEDPKRHAATPSDAEPPVLASARLRLEAAYDQALSRGVPPRLEAGVFDTLDRLEPNWERAFAMEKAARVERRLDELEAAWRSSPARAASDMEWLGATLRGRPSIATPARLHVDLDAALDALLQLVERSSSTERGDLERAVTALGSSRYDHVGPPAAIHQGFRAWVVARFQARKGAALEYELALSLLRTDGVVEGLGLPSPLDDGLLSVAERQRQLAQRPGSRAAALLALIPSDQLRAAHRKGGERALEALMPLVRHAARGPLPDLGPGNQRFALLALARALIQLAVWPQTKEPDGMMAEARASLRSLSELGEATFAERASAYDLLLKSYGALGRREELEEGRRVLEQGIAEFEDLHRKPGNEALRDYVWEARFDLAQYFVSQGERQDAIRHATRAVELAPPEEAASTRHYAAWLLLSGDHPTAADDAEQMVAPVLGDILRDGHPDHAEMLVRIAALRGDLVEARRRLEEARRHLPAGALVDLERELAAPR